MSFLKFSEWLRVREQGEQMDPQPKKKLKKPIPGLADPQPGMGMADQSPAVVKLKTPPAVA